MCMYTEVFLERFVVIVENVDITNLELSCYKRRNDCERKRNADANTAEASGNEITQQQIMEIWQHFWLKKKRCVNQRQQVLWWILDVRDGWSMTNCRCSMFISWRNRNQLSWRMRQLPTQHFCG